MTFEELLTDKHLYIGGTLETSETWGRLENEVIKDIFLKNECGADQFVVTTESGEEISANVEYSSPTLHKGYVSFNIPGVGRAYLYRKDRNA